MQLTAYRIVQEAFTNSLRYAGPRTEIELTLDVDGTDLRIVVHDSGGDGDGYRPPPAPHHGQGLLGIRERAAIFGGTAHAGRDPRGGWTVAATLGLTQTPPAEGVPA